MMMMMMMIIIIIIIIIIIANPPCPFCNKHEKRRGNNTVSKDTNSAAGKLPLYPLEMKQRWKIYYIQTCFHVEDALWLVAPCVRVIAFRRFEGTYRLHVQSYESVSWLITLMMKTVNFFQTSVTYYLNRGRNNPEYLLSQQSRGGCLQSLVFASLRIYFFLIILSPSFTVFFQSVTDFQYKRRKR